MQQSPRILCFQSFSGFALVPLPQNAACAHPLCPLHRAAPASQPPLSREVCPAHGLDLGSPAAGAAEPSKRSCSPASPGEICITQPPRLHQPSGGSVVSPGPPPTRWAVGTDALVGF